MFGLNKNICRIINISQGTTEQFLPNQCCGVSVWKKYGICMAGLSCAVKDYKLQAGEPFTHHFLITLDGEGIYQTTDKEYHLRRGDLLIHSAKYPHRYFHTGNKPWKILWIHHSPEHSDWQQLYEIKTVYQRNVDFNELLQIFTRIIAYQKERTPVSEKIVASYFELVNLLALNLFNLATGFCNYDQSQQFTELWNKVANNPHEKWTLNKMAEIMKMTPITLNRKCKKLYSMSPMNKVLSLRMERAEQLFMA